MPDMTRPEVAAVQEMNRGRRHNELKGRHKKTITNYVNQCSILNVKMGDTFDIQSGLILIYRPLLIREKGVVYLCWLFQPPDFNIF